ncbi:MAG TPA: DUF2513 domain-containing protein [Luteimonas sp.]
MHRDWDLVRKLLIAIADRQRPGTQLDGNDLTIEGYEDSLVAGHLLYMDDAGLIEAKEYRGLGSLEHDLGTVAVFKIMPKGHDLLDSIRADNVWNKTKERLTSIGGAASLEVLKQLAVSVTKEFLRLS